MLDGTVAVVAGGLLVGWWGLAAMLCGIALGLLLRRFQGWPVLAALAVLTGCLALVWDWMTGQSWAVEWTQAWSLVAVALCVAALAGSRRAQGGFRPTWLREGSSFRSRSGRRTPWRRGRGR